MTILDRGLLLVTGLLAAYQIAVGVDGLKALPMISSTIAFGVLLVAGLLLIVLGFDALDSPVVVIVSTVLPLSLSLSLAWEYLPAWRTPYLLFVILGFLAVVATRVARTGKAATFVLMAVHGVAGLMIFALPIVLSLTGRAAPGFALVGVGGALIGLGGLLLSFLKAGRPLLPRTTILRVLPGLLFLMTAFFVAGFALG